MKIQAVNIGQNKFCGPAVLSILTGRSTDDCASIIGSINGKYTIEGVQLKDLLEAADRLGFDCESVAPSASLYATLVGLVNKDGIYIVTVTGHFVVIEVSDKKIYFCDNHTKEPMPAASSARLLQQVKAVHKVSKRREPLIIWTKCFAITMKVDSGIQVEIRKNIEYDIKKYSRMITVAKFILKDEDELKRIIDQLGRYNPDE